MATKEVEQPQSTDTTPDTNKLADKVLERCLLILPQVERFKKPRLDRIQLYRGLYAGKVKRKFRQPHNIVLPAFSGLMDTVMADLNDDLSLDFREQEPADYLKVRKINPLWQMEVGSTAPNAKFAQKTRQDRSNALFSGRGFMMNYAVSDPEYKNCFEIFELEDAIFQPTGGAIWADHLYKGRTNIYRTVSQLKKAPYDQAQVKELLNNSAKTDFDPKITGDENKAALGKFKAMGLSPETADYIGEQQFKLAEMAITVDGIEYYILFSPWYRKWVRFAKLTEIFSAGIYPGASWATHEDNKNFLSKSYADDLYGVADAIHTLFNQEVTNREKSNYNARGYDVAFFPDVAKLDAAQTRPDALVPVTVPAGKKIEDGIFTFQTAQLSGTINLIQWIRQETGTDVGITDAAMGESQGVNKQATVMLAEQQTVAKRLLLRQSPYTEAMGEIGKLFIQGLKDHLPATRAIKLIGDAAEDWSEITRADLDLYSDVDVKIVSSSIDMRNSTLKKQARLKTLEMIGADPILPTIINPRWRAEELLRSGGEYDDSDIKMALDTKNYGDKEEIARAHEAIQIVLAGQKPQLYYGATTLLMQIIVDYASDNHNSLGPRYDTLIAFATAHQKIAAQNMARIAAATPPTPAPDATATDKPQAGSNPILPAARPQLQPAMQ
jgi:hypothetical protein